jgi:hypothetical protein
MTFTGDLHIVVTVGTQLNRSSEMGCRNRSAGCPQCGLRFLSAESATHTTAHDLYLMAANMQCMRDDMLHLARCCVEQYTSIVLPSPGMALAI